MSAVQIVFGSILLFLILLASWQPLQKPRSHGFYRFFGFVATDVIIVLNLPHWLVRPLEPLQIISWVLLVTSLLVGIPGVCQLRRHGGWAKREDSPETLRFEETERLVTTGIYRYIRHPMYSSLLFLSWGACFKSVTPASIAALAAAILFYAVTARVEEQENRRVFGDEYDAYMKSSRMFVPFII